MEKMSRAERARQFMPFAALRGFESLIEEQERIYTPRRELSEEEAERLSRRLSSLERGMVIRVVYYDRDAYVTWEGALTEVDVVFRFLRVIKTRISFEDLLEVEILQK